MNSIRKTKDIALKDNSESRDLSEEEKTLLGVIRALEIRPKDPETGESIVTKEMRVKLTKDGIKAFGSLRFKEQMANCPALLEALLQKKLLHLDGELYSLTDTGRIIGKNVRTKWHSEIYNDILVRSAESGAHASFCERVFGKNLCQYNVLDMEQLEVMLKILSLQPDDYVLDLGCGLGKITEYIAVKTDAQILGIDFAEKVIRWAQTNIPSPRNRVKFQVGDMNELALPASTFDAIIAIDTLYPVNLDDLDTTIGRLKTLLKPTGQMGIFYAQYQGSREFPDILQPENTEMAKALTKNGLSFETIDFTDNAHEIWRRELAAAQDLREKFEQEGNLDLCEERINQSKELIPRFENQQQRRYFYHVQLG
ncbi:MAG: methyltransferase domain-containing protein [Candidatus Thorarchaeota archaeon]